MEEQDVEVVQIVMQKVIRERIVYAVNPLAMPQSTKFAENLIHNEMFCPLNSSYKFKSR